MKARLPRITGMLGTLCIVAISCERPKSVIAGPWYSTTFVVDFLYHGDAYNQDWNWEVHGHTPYGPAVVSDYGFYRHAESLVGQDLKLVDWTKHKREDFMTMNVKWRTVWRNGKREEQCVPGWTVMEAAE